MTRIREDGESLAVITGTFDVVIAIDIFELVVDEHELAFELRRPLKSRDALIFICPWKQDFSA